MGKDQFRHVGIGRDLGELEGGTTRPWLTSGRGGLDGDQAPLKLLPSPR
ncbi:MAG: hypothetical protein OES69_04885 [Myxococcales bacterium]|nr:hypothetical protein [Myxococcales bacterium]MDH3843249.1 hypothetical protein [Myxococcales bacterium]